MSAFMDPAMHFPVKTTATFSVSKPGLKLDQIGLAKKAIAPSKSSTVVPTIASRMETSDTRIHHLIEKEVAVVVPSCFDALSAALLEKTGFKAGCISGYAPSASLLAKPDLGLLMPPEMAERARSVCSAVPFMPIIADAESGGENALNIQRTIKDLIAAGAAGCFLEAGADASLVETPRSLEELIEIGEKTTGYRVCYMVEGGVTPMLTPEELKSYGYHLIVHPLTTLYASAHAMLDVLKALKDEGSTRDHLDRMATFEEFNQLLSLGSWIKA